MVWITSETGKIQRLKNQEGLGPRGFRADNGIVILLNHAGGDTLLQNPGRTALHELFHALPAGIRAVIRATLRNEIGEEECRRILEDKRYSLYNENENEGWEEFCADTFALLPYAEANMTYHPDLMDAVVRNVPQLMDCISVNRLLILILPPPR